MNPTKLWIVLSIVISMALAACAPSLATQNPPTEVPTEVPTNIPEDGTVPGYDPKNGTYVIEGEPVTLVDGVAEKEIAPGSASKQVTRYFGNEVQLDLNADGQMDTAFLLTQEGGGSGTFFYVAAALNTKAGTLGTNAIFLGDRIAPQVTFIDPENPTQFIVSFAERKPDEPMSAQPSQMVSKTFKVEGDSLVEAGTLPTSTP